ncbi:MAG: DNA internalization-related competence protein ComEC/Rec2, partial [Usitatibacter sp.]
MRCFVLAFVFGTLCLQRSAELPDPLFAWGLVALALGVFLVRTRPRTRAVLLLLAGALAGFHYAAWRAEVALSEALPAAWEGRDIALEGRIANLPQPGERGTRFLFHVDRVETAGVPVPETLALTWYADERKDVAPPRLVPGAAWKLTVRLRRPRGLANPHTFDFEPWALERGVRATGYVRAKDSESAAHAISDGWPYTLHRWRSQIRESMQSELGDSRLRGVLVALAIGDQDAIAPDDWEVFWRTGVGHLMSISGLHITMLAGFGFSLAYFLWVRVPGLALRIPARKAAVVAGTLVALAYTLMTGYAVPAQRTFVMLAVIAVCLLLDRQGSSSRVLALAALAVLLLDPWAVLSAGFWLSFGAVAAIFYVMALRTGRSGALGSAVMEQLAVTVVMVPMLLALFQEVSLVSPIANAFSIPLVSLVVVPLAILGAFLQAPWLLAGAHTLMLWLMTPLEWLSELPRAMLESHAPEAWTVAVALAGCAWLLAPRGVPMRSLGAIWIVPLFTVAPLPPAWGEAWIEVLDVGNGLAVVVRTASHALAYDAGPSWSADADSGGRIVVPFLRGEGVEKLDGLVISHADDDHSGGAITLAASRDPSWLLSPLSASHALQILFDDSRRCEAGRRWAWDGVEFAVVHPAAAIYEEPPVTGRRARKQNDRSCVLRIATAGGSALLTGDAEARSEGEMLARQELVRADVLVVPHHGSRTSSTAAFLDAVAPSIAIFPVGYRNRFGH